MKVFGILVGKCSDEKDPDRVCDLFDGCPYNILNKAENEFLTMIFYIPEDHSWWLEEIKENPKSTLGLENADVFFSDEFDSSIEIDFQKGLEKAPCGTDCEGCGFYPDDCTGCPSTVYYMGE